MFCPLCKAEYRQGFSTCSDCLIPLVETEAQAMHTRVDRLWGGEKRHEFDSILAALNAVEIPFQPKETVSPRMKLRLSSIPVTLRSSFQYEILVLNSDLERAQAAIKGIFDDPYEDEEE
jgi:hypothetical protein